MQKQKLEYKRIDLTMIIKLPTGVELVSGPIVEKLLKPLALYNRFFRDKEMDEIVKLIKEFKTPAVPQEVVEARIDRKVIKQEVAEAAKKADFTKYKGIPDLVVSKDKVTLKGLSFPLPESFLNYCLEWHTAGQSLNPLINFMYNLAGNPSESVRNGLFDFMRKNKLILHPSGHLITVRFVAMFKKGSDSEPIEFAKKAFALIRLKKKSTADYIVGRDTKGQLQYSKKDEEIEAFLETYGTVKDLNGQSADPTIYTDAYTKTFRIKLGELVSMNPEDVDYSNASCSRGLHQTGTFALDSHGGNGSHIIMCLVNPAEIASIPYSDKFRCVAYLPIAEITREDVKKINEGFNFVYDDGVQRSVVTTDKIEKAKALFATPANNLAELNKKLKSTRPTKDEYLSKKEQKFLEDRVVKI